MKRLELQAAIDFAREGDVLIVTKIDRLARSVADLLSIIQLLQQKKVEMQILNLGMDTQTPTGKLMLVVLAGVAQFEREIMLERQREGVAKTKKHSGYNASNFKCCNLPLPCTVASNGHSNACRNVSIFAFNSCISGSRQLAIHPTHDKPCDLIACAVNNV